jgi:hypothetical protein
MNATNNGYLGFDNVRVPREQMLMKNAQVLEVRSAVIIWGWYRLIPVMHILGMHMHRHNLPTHTHKWSVSVWCVAVPLWIGLEPSCFWDLTYFLSLYVSLKA